MKKTISMGQDMFLPLSDTKTVQKKTHGLHTKSTEPKPLISHSAPLGTNTPTHTFKCQSHSELQVRL